MATNLGVTMDTVNGGSTFAAYLAQVYLSKRGYQPGTVPEATELAEACDHLLTASDGYTLRILCIIDRETRPDRGFAVSAERLNDIGRQCLAYTGTINHSKMPVVIELMEIGGDGPTEADRSRLSRYRSSSYFSKVRMLAWHLKPSTGEVWTNAAFGGFFSGRGRLRELMTGPHYSAEELETKPLPIQAPGIPIVALTFLAILVGVFAVEQTFGIGPSTGALKPTITTLLAMGGLSGKLVLGAGEWHRLLTAAFLHGDTIHLLMNGIALYFSGTILERLVGRAWFAALFFMGALTGSAASLAINGPNVVSVGASGAIMALMAAAYVTTYRLPHGGERTGAQIGLMRVLIPALMPLASSHIDVAAHAGGAAGGALAGFVLLKTWGRYEPLPRFRTLAAAIVLTGVLAILGSGALLSRGYQGYALVQFLVPDNVLPKTDTAAAAQAEQLVGSYPRDPRARLMLARVLLRTNSLDKAEPHLRAGLAEQEILVKIFTPELDWQLRMLLAIVRAAKGDMAEAKQVAAPVCASPKQTPMRETLVKERLCA